MNVIIKLEKLYNFISMSKYPPNINIYVEVSNLRINIK